MLVSTAMATDGEDSWRETSLQHLAGQPYPRRPWLLIAASLLLVVLSAVLWAKWADSRDRAQRLQAELKNLYAEAEAIRLQATRAQQRVGELEREIQSLTADRAAQPSSEPARRPRPR